MPSQKNKQEWNIRPHTYFKLRKYPRRTFYVFLAYEEKKIITIDISISLKEKMPHKKICPVSSSMNHNKSRICKKIFFELNSFKKVFIW